MPIIHNQKGQIEVNNRLVKSMIHCLVQEKPKQWDLLLPRVKFALNSIPNKTTGKSSFSVVYTKVPNLTMDLIAIPNPKSKLANSWTRDYQQFHQQIRKHIETMKSKYKQNIDKHSKLQELEGELLMVHLNKHKLPPGSCPKLNPRTSVPFALQRKLTLMPTLLTFQLIGMSQILSTFQ